MKNYLHMNSGNLFRELAFDHRYGRVYNRNLPRWYKREPDSRIPIVPSPDHIHLFVIGGAAGRFSAFIPGWGHMSSPVLRGIEGGAAAAPGLRRRHVLFVNGGSRMSEDTTRFRSARAGRCPSGWRRRRGSRGSRGCGSAFSTTPNGTPTGCCAKPLRSWATGSASPRSTTTRRKASAKAADPALIAEIAADNDIVLTAIGD